MFKSLISNSRRRQFFNLLIFYFIYLWTRGFSTAVLPPYFLEQNLNLQQIIFGHVATFFGAAILLLFLRQLQAKISWRIATILGFFYVLLIINITAPLQFYFASVLSGLTIIFYFIPYNIAHFSTTPANRVGLSSATLFILPTGIGLLTTLLAGYLGQADYRFIWILSGIFYAVSFWLVKYQKDFEINYNFFQSLKLIKATRLLIFLQGLWEAMIFGIIPVFSLLFITEPLHYGTFLAYLSLMGILANLLLGHMSDKLKQRNLFLYPIVILMALVTILFPSGLKSIGWWLILTGIVQFLTPLFWNLSTAIVVDRERNIKAAFVAREGLLMFGRALALLLVYVNFQFQSPPRLIFYFLGFVMLLYPAILFYNTRHALKS